MAFVELAILLILSIQGIARITLGSGFADIHSQHQKIWVTQNVRRSSLHVFQRNAILEILIADGDEPFRRRLRCAIESHPDWRVCGEATVGAEVIEKTSRLRPDVIVMNSAMPDFDGINEIHRVLPEATVVCVTQPSTTASQSQAGSHTEPVPTQAVQQDLAQVSVTLRGIAEAKRESGLDRTLADTFPCSDPLSSIPNPYLRDR